MNYTEKENNYYNQVRFDLIKFIEKNPTNKILEIGAGEGSTLEYLKINGYCEYCEGYDLMPFDEISNHIDKFSVGNIETDTIDFGFEKFDYILCGDVLEHLIEPRLTVEKLSKYLTKNGKIIVCTPNISEISIFKKIFILNDFRYTKSGILDYTHLRFFCKINLEELLTTDNLKVVKSLFNLYATPTRRIISKFTFGLIDRYMAPQLIVVSEKI